MPQNYNPKFRLKFYRTDTINNTPIEPGNMLVNMDNGKIYIDLLFTNDTVKRVSLSGGIVYCGTVANYAALQNIQHPTNGDLYNVADTGANYCWSENDNTWDKLSETIDISGKVDASVLENYYTKTEADNAFVEPADLNNYYTKTEADSTFVSEDELEDLIDILNNALSAS